MINPVTVIGEVDDVATTNQVIDVILYHSIADHQLVNGGSKSNTASPFVPAASIFCGTPGTVTGTTLFEGALNTHVVTEVCATTVNVYVTPFVKPSTVIGLSVHVAMIFHGDDLTM